MHSVRSVATLFREMIHVRLGQQDSGRILYATQNGMRFITYKLFFSWNFPFTTLEHSQPLVPDVAEIETADNGGLL